MGRVLGILMMVVLLWGALEIYTKGTNGAFGGLMAGWFEPIPAPSLVVDGVPLHQAVGDRVQADINNAFERREGAMID